MNKILIFLVFPIFVLSQNIKGKVTNANNEPIEGASVYLDGTTIGTTTDANGNFEIVEKNKFNTLLIVRYLGFEDIIISNPYEKDYFVFILVPKQNEIETVLIVKDGYTRKQKLKLFKEQFLGLTKYGKACKILNEDAIDFNYDLKSLTFTATSVEPIKINNPYLGYTIDFDLHTFYVRFKYKSIHSRAVGENMYLGTAKYTDNNSKAKILKNRKDVYLGSSMHFFKNIVTNAWSNNGFILFKDRYNVQANEYFIVSKYNDDLNKVEVKQTIKPLEGLVAKNEISVHADFNLLYKKNRQSRVIFKTDVFYVDNFGNNSHRDRIVFGGDIGQQKVGNILPLNFELENLEKEVETNN